MWRFCLCFSFLFFALENIMAMDEELAKQVQKEDIPIVDQLKPFLAIRDIRSVTTTSPIKAKEQSSADFWRAFRVQTNPLEEKVKELLGLIDKGLGPIENKAKIQEIVTALKTEPNAVLSMFQHMIMRRHIWYSSDITKVVELRRFVAWTFGIRLALTEEVTSVHSAFIIVDEKNDVANFSEALLQGCCTAAKTPQNLFIRTQGLDFREGGREYYHKEHCYAII